MISSKWPILRNQIEHLARSRAARISLATGLIGFGAWAFFPYVAYKVAPAAYVNAELIRVTAPINGRLTQDLPHKGDLTNSSRTIKLIESTAIDRSNLVSIERQYDEAKAKANLALSQMSELTAADLAFTRRMEQYKAALAKRQDSEIAEIQHELQACRDVEKVKRSALDRAEEMTRRQLIAEMQLELIKGDYFNTVQACQGISSREQKLTAEREATSQGIFVQDGTGVPSFAQERSNLLFSRQERERELLDARSKEEQLQAQISAVRSHTDSLDHYDANLPAGYIVWAVQASPGSAVIEGQTIMELANCRNPFLIVEFPERELASIAVGDSADVRLIGETQWQRSKVRRVRGSAARSDDMLLAAATPTPEEHYIAVEIEMPVQSGAVEADRACNIGRLVEVRLQRHPLALFSWLSGMRANGEIAQNAR